jgi:hypothetical protein
VDVVVEGPQDAPASIRRSVALVWAVVAMSVLNVLLTFVLIDDLVSGAMQSGAAGLTEDTARRGVVLNGVLGLLFAGLWVVLARLLGRGVGWARVALTVLAGIGVLFGLVGLSLAAQPTPFLVVGVVTLVLEVALLFFLWQRDASAFIRSRRDPA